MTTLASKINIDKTEMTTFQSVMLQRPQRQLWLLDGRGNEADETYNGLQTMGIFSDP